MVSIMYLVNNDKKKAVSYLESHLRLYKFNKIIADKLVLFYKEQKNINGVISMYKRLHKRFPDSGYVYELINLFIATNDKKSLVKFLETSDVKSSIFKQIHGFINNSKTSFYLTKKLYKKTKDIDFLAQSLMFEYEYLYQINKLNDSTIKKIHNGFKKVLKKSPHPNYFNYVGYVLIEHNIDVKIGIGYVKKALRSNPKSPFYLDSLAWGYYKLKKYQKAYKTMQKVILITGLNNVSIKEHWDVIQKKAEKKTKRKTKKKKK
jgi:tetratricopeptide (TPR) repeat protein